MSQDDLDDVNGSIDRRRILGMLGGGTAAVASGLGSVQADPGKGKGKPGGDEKGKPGKDGRGGGVGPCTCDGCTEGFFCGKVEGPPEKTTYTFSEGGESYSVTVTGLKKKEGGEVTGFTFSTSDDIDEVCVKGGPETATYDEQLDGWLEAPENPGGQQAAISNFSFCGAQTANYQIDLVTGHDVICGTDLAEDNKYGGSRLLAVLAVGETGDVYQTNTIPREDDGLRLESNPISFDESNQTATVDLAKIDDGIDDDGEYALVGYEFLDPGVTTFDEDLDDGTVNQSLRACDIVTGPKTLEIDLDGGDCEQC